MTDTKITRAMFLRAALEMDGAKLSDPAYKTVGEKMLATITAPRAKSTSSTPSKAHRDNECAAKVIAEMIPSGSAISPSWIVEHSPYGEVAVLTPQKAVGVMNVAISLGLFARSKEGKKVVYIRQ